MPSSQLRTALSLLDTLLFNLHCVWAEWRGRSRANFIDPAWVRRNRRVSE